MHASIFFKVLNVLNSPFQSSPNVHAFCDRLWLCPLPSNCMTFQKKRISGKRGRVSADLLPSLSLFSQSSKSPPNSRSLSGDFFYAGETKVRLASHSFGNCGFFFRRNNSGKTVVPPLVQFSLKIYFCRPSRCYQSWSEGKSRRGPAHRFLPLKIK